MSRRLASAALVLTVPALVLAACSSSDDLGSSTEFSDGQVRQALSVRVGEQAAEDQSLSDMLRAELRTAAGESVGEVVFSPAPGESGTVVLARVDLPDSVPGKSFHGFHVHSNDDPANGEGCVADAGAAPSTWFVSADGHFAGTPGATHGDHAGDMPAVYVDGNGRADTTFVTDTVRASDLRGKAVMLHVGGDNFGTVPTGAAPEQYAANSDTAVGLTSRTGNGGDRLACGVIGNYEG